MGIFQLPVVALILVVKSQYCSGLSEEEKGIMKKKNLIKIKVSQLY